jgi:hypothetical protein
LTNPPVSGSYAAPLPFTVELRPGWWANLSLRIGIWALALGVLVFLAARSVGGGVAGIILSALLWWGVFEFAVLPVRATWSEGRRLTPQHATLGGCLTLISICGGGGIFLLFGPSLILGLIIGPIVAVLSHRNDTISIARSLGLNVALPPAPQPASPPFQLPGPRWALAVLGLVAFLGGLTFMSLGTLRSLEVYGTVTDFCLHPCGMAYGVWVDVVPGPGGAAVTRLDSAAVGMQVRFHNDVAEARTVSRDQFTLELPATTELPRTMYPALTVQPACPAWTPRTLHIDEATADLALCFAVPQSSNVALDQLVLDWSQPGGSIQVSLGKPGTGTGGITLNAGASPSPS